MILTLKDWRTLPEKVIDLKKKNNIEHARKPQKNQKKYKQYYCVRTRNKKQAKRWKRASIQPIHRGIGAQI